MKKFILIIVLCLFVLPSKGYALSLGTNIIGNEKVKPGENIIYTVILDQALNEYSAEITYDRSVLNLVNVTEVNINTTTKEFLVEKANPIKINIKSEELANIVYKLEFNVKNYVKATDTELSIKTLTAKTIEEEFTPVVAYEKINIVEDDVLFEEDIPSNEEDNYAKTLVNDIKNILNDYANPITYVSIALNIILIIALITNIRRKRVDYDF